MYCPRCGTENEEDARFCKGCGHDLAPHAEVAARPPPRDKDWDEDCDRQCFGTPARKSWFWGVLIALVGVFIIWEFAIKEMVDLPREIRDFEFCWVAWIIVGIFVVLAGIRVLQRSGQWR